MATVRKWLAAKQATIRTCHGKSLRVKCAEQHVCQRQGAEQKLNNKPNNNIALIQAIILSTDHDKPLEKVLCAFY